MSPMRHAILVSALCALAACSKSQPPGVPEQASTPPPPATSQPRPAAPPTGAFEPVADLPAPIEAAPPPLDDQIPPYAQTGFPDCDDYIETYRQCLNTRLNGEERKARASELKASVRAIVGNIARGVDPARVAKRCVRARGLAAKKLVDLGCPL